MFITAFTSAHHLSLS